MMKKHNFAKRMLALLLVLVMTLGYLPVMTNAAELEVSNKVADPETLNNWQGYYGDSSLLPDGSTGISTWKAGGVWTDKSVFANNTDITAAGLPTSLADPNAFLVSLSALASNQEIVGQSSAPTDTMLVLDLSNSMDTSGSVPTMIAAANETIDTLMKMNVNNRVGVVLYSGNASLGDSEKNTATVILPLDHYTTTTSTREWEQQDGQWVQVTKYQYLTVTGNSDTTVSVASGTLDSNKDEVKGSKRTNGGTYIQNGLYQAYEEFISMADKGVVQSGTQKGIQRTPIMVLMSDGAPTVATTSYYNVQTSNEGNGSRNGTTNKITFLTQLTAAWVKGKVGAYYNNATAKFYTLGLGTGNDEQATAVLYPSGSNRTLTDYWNNFNTGSTDGRDVTIGSGNGRFTVQYQSAAEAIGKNYVDMYKSASSSGELIAAFKEIVDEIGLQSAYTATLVESGEADLDGYITVQDELGSMMEVKDIKGILLGNTLFTGAEFAKSMNEGDLGGDADNATDYGNEFIRTVKERLNIDTSTAQQLVNAAYMDGQLSYTNNSTYSNYLGWYGDENNAYLGFWDKDSGMTSVGAPAGAKYINRSYLYLGEAQASDMMHVIVMVRTEIANGHQTMQFRVPASLIPMVRYHVELEGDSLETATDITLTVEETDPIRLLYEVGLPDDVNEVNLEQKVAEYLTKDGSNHIHKNADGSYTFYANSWGAVNEVAPDIANMSDEEKLALTEKVAESHFIPNTANERFYIQEDALIYTKSGDSYVKATSQPVAGTDYYFVRTIVNVTGANGKAEAVPQYEKLYAATVANASNFTQNDDGDWVVKAGTVRQTLSTVGLPKTPNATGTIANSDHLWVDITGNTARDHHIYSFLGNNGKLTVMPTSGIKVTKDVTELADGQSADEKFPIVVTLSQASGDLQITDAEGNALPTEAYNVNGNVITLYLADGETAYIGGLTVGTTYTVAEEHSKYTPSYIYENADKTVRAGYIDGVTVTNAPVKNGSLYITKEVVHAHEGETIPTGYEFDFRVTFLDANGDPIANKAFDIINNHDGDLTRSTDANGVMTGKLCHGETAHILGIPAGATVTVEEVNLPADGNYTLAGYRSRDYSGGTADTDGIVTIQSGQNATVVVTNTYTPKSTTVDLDIPVTKTFIAESVPTEVITFIFEVQQWNGTAWESITRPNGNDVVCYMNFWDNYTVVGENVINATFENALEGITYTQAGVYSYQVIEQIPNDEEKVPGLVYDRTLWTFTVTVTDVNGQLVATVTDKNNQPITDGSYEVSFLNQSHAAPVSINISKEVDDKSGNPLISKAGFEFVAVQTNANWEPLTGEDASSLSLYSDGAGAARMSATYKTPGSYYYVVSEVDGGKPGWTYTEKEYWIEVAVTDDGTGNLSATLIIDGVDQKNDDAALTFTNVYDPADAEVSLETLVDKKLTGRDLVKGEFEFAIYPNGQTTGAVAIGTNDTEGNVIFTPEKLTFSKIGKYEYDVVEIDNALGGVTYDGIIYDLVIEVTDEDQNGVLEATYYFEDSTEKTVVFNNTYTTEPTEVVIEGLKTIQVNSGWKELAAGMFTFGLYDSTGKEIATTTNLANGSFLFDAIVYELDDVGTHTYTVKEIAGAAAGITYDDAEFTVTVEVADNGDGTLSAVATGNGVQNMEFVNIYRSNPVSVTLSGTKTLAGRDLAPREFTYAVYESDAGFAERTQITNQITHDADGNITFALGSLDMGYHYFVLKEVIPEERAAGIHYDASEYHVTVQVTDSGNGQMSAITTVKHTGNPNAVNPAIAFKNIYRPDDTSVIIEGTKVLNGGKPLAADDYTFKLYDESGAELGEAKVKADGTFSFDAITYTADDVGEPIVYTVKEQMPAGATAENGYVDGSITYDSTVYTVTVEVTDNKGVLEVAKTISNGTETANSIVFTNTHTPDPIPLDLEATKAYNKDFGAGKFTFTLEGEGFTKQEKTNDADGKVTFDTLQLTEAKTYTFTVKEKEEILWGFISWDKSEYTVTVTVENQNGVLVITDQTVTVGQEAKDGGIIFNNEYKLDGDGKVELSGRKTLSGDRTSVNAGEFEFGLYDASGALVESVKNDANGNFAFAPLTFTETDTTIDGENTYVYTVKEIAGDNARYTYDDTIYTVTVTVKDNDQGGIDVSHVIKNGNEEAELTFTNTYTNPAPVTYAPEAQKHYNKDMVGGEFNFQLEGEIAGQKIEQTKTNDADGKVSFDNLSFPEAGEYTFTVKEIDKVLGFINYSTAEHTLVVKVIDTKGVLSIESVTVNADPNGTIEFTNVYKFDGDGKVELSGRKTLSGDRTSVNAGEFEFGLYDASGALVESVKNDANGNFAFAPLTFTEADTTIDGENTYVYTVKEIAGDNAGMTYDDAIYTVTVTVKDNDQGDIAVNHEITENGAAAEIAFENTYTITGTGSAQIAGTKTYDGKQLQGDDFVFVLAEGETELEQVKNAADGTFAFQPITYTKADIGVHTYTVSEQRPADAEQTADGSYVKDGTIYDANIYTVEVTVADDGNGGLSVTQKVNNQAADEINVAFDNAYQIFGTGKLELEGDKTLTGGKVLKDGDFTFGLYEGEQLIAQAENKDGKFLLVKEYTVNELGEYTYTVAEILPAEAVDNGDGTYSYENVTYDPTVYTVYVSVVDNQKGGIDVTYDLEDAEAITFENTYTPDDQIVTIEIQKVLDNKTNKKVSLEGFQFEIACGKDVHTTKSNAEGKAGFEVTFSAAHIGQSYEFKVSEKNTGIKGMTYDKTVYTIKVQVQQNEDGTIKTVINDQVADKAAVKFTNVYEELVTPPLGDDFKIILPIALMLLSILGIVTVITMRKKKAA